MKELYIGWDEEKTDAFIGTMEEIKKYEGNLEDIESLEDFEINDIIDFLEKEIKHHIISMNRSIIKFELNKEFELIELIIEDYKKDKDILEMNLDSEITNFDNKKMQHLIKNIKNNEYLAPYIEII